MSESPAVPPKKRHWFLFFLVVIVILLIVFVPFALFTDTPLRISRETTYLTEPLTPDETQVDYPRALEEQKYPPQMQTDDNGCRILVQALGAPVNPAAPALTGQYYEKLGLSATHTPTLVHVGSYEFVNNYFAANPNELEKWKEKYIELNKAKDPFFNDDPTMIIGDDITMYVYKKTTSRDFPPWETWLKQVDPVLDMLAEAVRKPVFVMPLVFLTPEDFLFNTNEATQYRELALSLEKRIPLRIDAGNIDGAIDDIITCRRLGRHYKNQGMLIHYLVGDAIEGIAIVQGPNANPEVPMNAEQLKRMIREIDELPEFVSLKAVFNKERIFMLSSIQGVLHSGNKKEMLEDTDSGTYFFGLGKSRGNWWEKYLKSGHYTSALGYDWNIVTKRINKVYDQIIEEKNVEIHLSSNPLVWLSKKGRSEELGKKFVEFLAHSKNDFYEVEHRSQCVQQMQRIALAMLLYEQEHGTLPPTWSVGAPPAEPGSAGVSPASARTGDRLHRVFANENAGETPAVPGHCWRVLMLPYLGDEKLKELYEKIQLDEPWDSEWNSQFHTVQIDLYSCPTARKKRVPPVNGLCDYTVIVGDETPFADRVSDGKLLGRSSKDYGPYTILLAERANPVCWMDPTQEVSQSDAETFAGHHTGGSNFALKSGAGVFLSATIDMDRFREYIRGTAENAP